MKPAGPNKFRTHSSVVSAFHECVDMFGWKEQQKFEALACILISTKAPLVVTAIMLQWLREKRVGGRPSGSDSFDNAQPGELGMAFIENCSVTDFSAVPGKTARLTQFCFHAAKKNSSLTYDAAFFAGLSAKLRKFVKEGDDNPELHTADLLKKKEYHIDGIGKFTRMQILPLACLMKLSTNLNCSQDATMLAKKPHYIYMMGEEGGLKTEVVVDRMVECVAESMELSKVEVENTLCEIHRKIGVFNFQYVGQSFYNAVRSSEEPGHVVILSKGWGEQGKWSPVGGDPY